MNLQARFVLVYMLLGGVVCCAALGAYAAFSVHTVQARLSGQAAQISRIQAALGPTGLAALETKAEKAISAEAQTQGITVLGQQVVQVKQPSASEIDIYVKVKTAELGTVELDVALQKGVYQIAGVQQVA